MDARENRFKKLRKLGKREGESYFDDLLQESQHREKDMNKAPATKVEERPKAMETDAILEKFKFENKPKKAPGFLRQLSSEGKNTADSDGNNSPDQSGGSPERLRLKRLKKILNPSETKESFEEEIKDEPECPICLSKIEKDSARINCCNHIFCFDCIKEWTDVANQCPLCKKRISRIQKFSADGVKINEVRIKFKEQEFQEPEFETIESKNLLISNILSEFRY